MKPGIVVPTNQIADSQVIDCTNFNITVNNCKIELKEVKKYQLSLYHISKLTFSCLVSSLAKKEGYKEDS
jgi:hypothetical protein